MTTPILTMGLSLKEPLNYVKSSTFLICWFFFWVYWQFVNNPTELTTSKWWKTSKMAVLILKLALFQVRSLSNSMYCSNILVQISSYFYQPTRESRAGQARMSTPGRAKDHSWSVEQPMTSRNRTRVSKLKLYHSETCQVSGISGILLQTLQYSNHRHM